MAWLALNREVGQLTEEWGRLEVWLCDEHNWFSLNADEQVSLPEGRQLYRVDELRSRRRQERDDLLIEIPRLPAKSPTAVLFKLAVVAALIDPNDQPDTHALVESCMQDLAAL